MNDAADADDDDDNTSIVSTACTLIRSPLIRTLGRNAFLFTSFPSLFAIHCPIWERMDAGLTEDDVNFCIYESVLFGHTAEVEEKDMQSIRLNIASRRSNVSSTCIPYLSIYLST